MGITRGSKLQFDVAVAANVAEFAPYISRGRKKGTS